jgi:hypothetical protein
MLMPPARTSMLLRAIAACLLLVSFGAAGADRGPSTAAERSQALQYIHRFQADPLNPDLKAEIQWVLKWTMDVPDIRLDLCISFYKLPKAGSKDGQILFDAMVLAQTAFVLENPDRKDDGTAQVEAGVEGVLRVYELLLKANSRDREPYLDKLIKRRDAGTLAQFVEQRAPSACTN